MIPKKGFTLVAAMVLSAGLLAPSAEAKCSKDCKGQIKAAFQECVATCKTLPTGKEKRSCKKIFCKPAKKSATADCKAATSPTPPSCGSPSGAFVD